MPFALASSGYDNFGRQHQRVQLIFIYVVSFAAPSLVPSMNQPSSLKSFKYLSILKSETVAGKSGVTSSVTEAKFFSMAQDVVKTAIK